MRAAIHFVLPLLILASSVGCTTTDEVAPPFVPVQGPESTLTSSASLPAARAALGALGDNYQYVRRSSGFTGLSIQTTVGVETAQVTLRTYVSWQWGEGGVAEIVEEWSETGASVGSHEGGHGAVTLGQLYDVCETDILTRDPATHEIILRVFASGLIATCLAIPHGCADDCGDGFTIESVTPGATP